MGLVKKASPETSYITLNLHFPFLAIDLTNGEFNMKNPACYIFPKENNCEIGDHFNYEQLNELKQFTEYKGYDFKTPISQKFFNWLSPIILIICLSYLVIFSFIKLRLS